MWGGDKPLLGIDCIPSHGVVDVFAANATQSQLRPFSGLMKKHLRKRSGAHTLHLGNRNVNARSFASVRSGVG